MHILKCCAPGTLTVSSLVALALSSSTALAQTTDFIGKFSGPTTLNNSVLFQSGPQIGLGTTAPLDFMSIQFNNASGSQTGLALKNTAASRDVLFRRADVRPHRRARRVPGLQ